MGANSVKAGVDIPKKRARPKAWTYPVRVKRGALFKNHPRILWSEPLTS